MRKIVIAIYVFAVVAALQTTTAYASDDQLFIAALENAQLGNSRIALDQLEDLAEKDYPGAYYYIGLMYNMGTGVDKDTKIAVRYFEKAAENGYCAAYSRLASLYYVVEMSFDGERIAHLLSMAETCGSARSVFFLGMKEEFSSNMNKAFEYYIRSAKLGYADAAHRIIQLVRDEGFEIKRTELLSLLVESAYSGSSIARDILRCNNFPCYDRESMSSPEQCIQDIGSATINVETCR